MTTLEGKAAVVMKTVAQAARPQGGASHPIDIRMAVKKPVAQVATMLSVPPEAPRPVHSTTQASPLRKARPRIAMLKE